MQLARSGDRAGARLAFIEALKIDSHNEIALLGLVSVTSEQKERIAALRKAFIMYPNSPKVAEAMRRLNITGEQLVGTTTNSLAANVPRPATSDLEPLKPTTADLQTAAPPAPTPPAEPAPAPEPPPAEPARPRPLLKKLSTSTSEMRAVSMPPAEEAPTAPTEPTPPAEPAPAPEPAPVETSLQDVIAQLTVTLAGEDGVPRPSRASIEAAFKEAALLVQKHEQTHLQSSIAFGRKEKNRAGEGDRRRFQTRVGLVASAAISLVGVFVLIAALGNPDVQRLVFAPTWTVSPTPTSTATPTPGLTPTPSPTPRQSPTPSPTFPPALPVQNPLVQPRPTDVTGPVGVLIEPRIRQAVALINQGQFSAARTILNQEKRAAELTGNFTPYYYSALLEVLTGNISAAREIVQTGETFWRERVASDLQLPMIDVSYARVSLAEQAQRPSPQQDALRDITQRLERAIATDPTFIEPHLLLADRYVLVNNRAQAITVLQTAIERNPTNTELRAKLAEVYLLDRRYDEALQAVYEALLLDPYSERSLQLQVEIALAKGDPGLAVLFAEQYMARYPGRVLAVKLRADARVAEGKLDWALYDYSRALNGDRSERGYLEALLQRATLYAELGRYDLAREDLTEALRLRDERSLRVSRMMIALEAGDLETALEDAEALRAEDSPPPEAVLVEYTVRLAQGNVPDAAVEDVQRILDNLTGSPRFAAFELLARLYTTRSDYANALDMVNNALRGEQTIERRLLRAQIYEAQANARGVARAERNRLLRLALADLEWVNGFSAYFNQVDRESLAEALERVASGIG
ncbi:MAG: tetratricopeptide repeat protein [Anaerolineae bacterium]